MVVVVVYVGSRRLWWSRRRMEMWRHSVGTVSSTGPRLGPMGMALQVMRVVGQTPMGTRRMPWQRGMVSMVTMAGSSQVGVAWM